MLRIIKEALSPFILRKTLRRGNVRVVFGQITPN